MHDDTIEPFWFPAVGRKKLTAAFDGGRLTSDDIVDVVHGHQQLALFNAHGACPWA